MTGVKVPISPKIHDIERYLVEVSGWRRAPRDAQWLAGGYPKNHPARIFWNVRRSIHSLIDHFILTNSSLQITPYFAKH